MLVPAGERSERRALCVRGSETVCDVVGLRASMASCSFAQKARENVHPTTISEDRSTATDVGLGPWFVSAPPPKPVPSDKLGLKY